MKNDSLQEPLLVHEPGTDSSHLRAVRSSLEHLTEAELVVLSVLVRQRLTEHRERRGKE